MSRRKTPRLAPPEYVSRDPNKSSQVYWARIQLLEAVQRVYPAMLERLSTDVFPHYSRLAKLGEFDRVPSVPGVSAIPKVTPLRNLIRAHGIWPAGMLNWWLALKTAAEAGPTPARWDALPGDSELKLALSKWATAFNADVEWIKSLALRILQDWYFVGKAKTIALGAWAHASQISTTAEGFEFRYPGWELELLPWSIYRKSLEKRLQEKLLDYEKSARKLAASRGLVRSQRKYSPQNFDWFVLYQFAGFSSVAIVNWWWAKGKDEIDESTVLQGTKKVAELVGWQRLRTPQRQRNRKIR
jgi:hypothetical protein